MPLEERRIQIKQPQASVLSQNISIENREKLTITGAEDVINFTENTVVLLTNMGVLTVKGSELHINKLNVESGDVVIEGRIDSLAYSDHDMGRQSGGSLFSKLFK